MIGDVGVVLVEGQDIARRGLSDILETLSGVEFLGSAACYERAAVVIGLRRQAPDVLVVASDVLDHTALESLRSRREPQPLVLVLIKGEEPPQLQAAAALCADGYAVERDLTPETLLRAVLETARGGMPMPGVLARFLVDRNSRRTHSPSLALLTPREEQVLALLAQGNSNKQIARNLGISEHGAKHHVGGLLAKLRSSTRAAAVVEAGRLGLLR